MKRIFEVTRHDEFRGTTCRDLMARVLTFVAKDDCLFVVRPDQVQFANDLGLQSLLAPDDADHMASPDLMAAKVWQAIECHDEAVEFISYRGDVLTEVCRLANRKGRNVFTIPLPVWLKGQLQANVPGQALTIDDDLRDTALWALHQAECVSEQTALNAKALRDRMQILNPKYSKAAPGAIQAGFIGPLLEDMAASGHIQRFVRGAEPMIYLTQKGQGRAQVASQSGITDGGARDEFVGMANPDSRTRTSDPSRWGPGIREALRQRGLAVHPVVRDCITAALQQSIQVEDRHTWLLSDHLDEIVRRTQWPIDLSDQLIFGSVRVVAKLILRSGVLRTESEQVLDNSLTADALPIRRAVGCLSTACVGEQIIAIIEHLGYIDRSDFPNLCWVLFHYPERDSGMVAKQESDLAKALLCLKGAGRIQIEDDRATLKR